MMDLRKCGVCDEKESMFILKQGMEAILLCDLCEDKLALDGCLIGDQMIRARWSRKK